MYVTGAAVGPVPSGRSQECNNIVNQYMYLFCLFTLPEAFLILGAELRVSEAPQRDRIYDILSYLKLSINFFPTGNATTLIKASKLKRDAHEVVYSIDRN